MKRNYLKIFITLIVIATFSIYQMQAQTSGSGTLGGSGCTAAGTTGGCTNTFIGSASGGSSNTGTDNSFLGAQAGNSNTTGTDNTAVGYQSLYSNISGTYSTAIGTKALYSVSSKTSQSTAVGYCALYTLSQGDYNTAVGGSSLYNNNGSYNSGLGYYSLYNNTSGGSNTAMGSHSLYFNATGSQNCAIGPYAGYGVTGNSHSYNTFMGYYSGYGITTGTYNTLLGWKSGVSNTTGQNNTEVGAASGGATTTGSSNTFLGYFAGYSNTSSNYNTMVGAQAGFSNTSANNTFVGLGAGYDNTSNGNNSAFGMYAGYQSTGGNNTCLGYYAGYDNTTGANNTYVGYDATAGAGTYSNDAVIGYDAVASTSNQVLLGNGSITNLTCYGAKATGLTSIGALCVTSGGQIGISSSSQRYKKDIVPLEINTSLLYKLRPVSFSYKNDGTHSFGLIAEEVNKVLPELVFYRKAKDVIPGSTSEELVPEGVHYENLPVLLLAELQKQHSKIDSLEGQLTQIKSQINGNITTGNNSGVKNNYKVVELSSENAIVLNQNDPNPFAEETDITYYLPDNVNNAKIMFYDNNGKIIKSAELEGKGSGTLHVYSSSLSAGIYTYALIADGKTIDSKKMVKSK